MVWGANAVNGIINISPRKLLIPKVPYFQRVAAVLSKGFLVHAMVEKSMTIPSTASMPKDSPEIR